MGQVGISRCKNYDYDKTIERVESLLSELNVLKGLKPGKILLKTNLLKKNLPEDGVTTHPFVVEGVARYLMKKGFQVIIGDSPGGPFNKEKAGSEAVQAALEKRYNLDKPVGEQYVLYMKNLLRGDWGVSLKTGRDIWTDIAGSDPSHLHR